MQTNPVSDLVKTHGPPGIVLGVIHAVEIQTGLEITLLALSIAYTAIRLAMLLKKRNRDQALQDELDETEPEDFV